MQAIEAKKLAQVWATAKPLHRYTMERAREQPVENAPSHAEVPTFGFMRVDWSHESPQFQEQLRSAREATRNEFVAGTILSLGRTPDSGDFAVIDYKFWIGAEIDWVGNTASYDGKTMIEIRVVDADVLSPSHSAPPVELKRLSVGEVIRAAIADYAKHDPYLKRPPDERYRAYRTYISRHDYNPFKDRGFSEENFERYETDYRNENRHLFPK